ncbi:hypothetical protein [Polynucleobacter sp. AP-Feld-500C-C5]|uniref:hypothetical protein n=1 Tax=Polynucleobacter sp. AP-Feld-500C-C5 TaxID=2576924 RepID=UPI001C0AA81E|nr:hypothetical protein [Polynucleobacter sp. AP-Feld-500C-C5]MBU3632887.1 hypothetical protein [Polynucleobacter sp. AP-Feld-500C-C5]
MFNVTLRLLLGYSFFVHFLIAYFETQAFFFPYILIPIISILILCKSGINKEDQTIYVLFILYIISIIYSVHDIDIDNKDFINIINILFMIPVFIYSKKSINNYFIFNKYLKIFIYSGIIMSIYSLKQLMFGYEEFEINAIAKMGSTLNEYLEMGRIRVTSLTFDPLLTSFMFSICIFLTSCKIFIDFEFKNKIKKINFLFIIIFFIAMNATLTRAPILGAIIGFLIILIANLKLLNIKKIIFLILLNITIIYILIYSTYEFIAFERNYYTEQIFDTFFSLFKIFNSSDISHEDYFLIGQSRDHRIVAIKLAFEYIFERFIYYDYPKNQISNLDFSLQDIGILSVGVRYGLISYLINQALYLYILKKSINGIINCHNLKERGVSYILLGLWIMIIVSVNISDISTGIVSGLLIWSIAAIIINKNKIFNGI